MRRLDVLGNIVGYMFCALLLLGACVVFYRTSSDLLAHGYTVVKVGPRTSSGRPVAVPGMYGWMIALAGPLAMAAFAFLGLRKFRLVLACLVMSCALFALSTVGHVRCAGDVHAPRCDISAGAPVQPVDDYSLELASRRRAVSGFLLLLGFGAAACAAVQWRDARASLHWSRVEGEILESKLTGTSRFRWDWAIQYRYRVDGQVYVRNRACFAAYVPFEIARKIVSKFPAYSAATVFHHPARHGKSVLLPGANKYTYYSFLLLPACWFIAFVLWFGK